MLKLILDCGKQFPGKGRLAFYDVQPGRQLLGPQPLFRCFGNGNQASYANSLHRRVGAHSRSNQHTGSDKTRATDTLTAMNGYVLPVVQGTSNLLPRAKTLPSQFRRAPVQRTHLQAGEPGLRDDLICSVERRRKVASLPAFSTDSECRNRSPCFEEDSIAIGSTQLSATYSYS
jgi:hypothetical protein